MKTMSRYYNVKNWCILWDKQKGKCYYCGLNLKKKYLEEGKWIATIDHIRAKCWCKDKWEKRNLAIACEFCNYNKGAMTATKFRKLLKEKSKAEIRKITQKKYKYAPWRIPRKYTLWNKVKKKIKNFLQRQVNKIYVVSKGT
jgi:hypothetical protein